MPFTDEQIQRYSRHILLKGVGGKGQRRLLDSRVLIVGTGGLGSPIALYLAAAGVGHLGLIDPDTVELSNLQRQIIHHTSDLDRPKVLSAAEKIAAVNPDVEVTTYQQRLTKGNIIDLITTYDFVVEGTDNFPTKFLVNDACIMTDMPFNQGGILRFQGQTMTHVPGSASYRCVYRQPPPPGAVPTCSEAGVLGAVAGMLGTIQATETLKYLLGIGELLTNRILMFDALTMQTRIVDVAPTEWADLASENRKVTKLVEYEQEACDLDLEKQYGSAQEGKRIEVGPLNTSTQTSTGGAAVDAAPTVAGNPRPAVEAAPGDRSISIPQSIIDQIHEQALSEEPDEACGYLIGSGSRVGGRIEMTNVDHSPEHFSFDPSEQFAAVKQAREAGKQLVAVYHSHPETPARMSQEDIRLANDTQMIYVIHSLADDTTRAFTVDAQKQVSAVSVTFTDAAGARV